MNADDITSLSYLYIFVAMVVSIFVAAALEKRLKERMPATRPYRWGFYFGCMGVSCVPFALLAALGMLVAGMNNRWEAFGECLALALFCTIAAISGWFVIQRKRWAWVVSTIFSCNIFTWIINFIYGRNRWGEFVGEHYGSAGTEDEGYELLADATKLEIQGRVQEAIAVYQRVVDGYSHTKAGQDAKISIDNLTALKTNNPQSVQKQTWSAVVILGAQVFCCLQESLNINPSNEQWEHEFLRRLHPQHPIAQSVMDELWNDVVAAGKELGRLLHAAALDCLRGMRLHRVTSHATQEHRLAIYLHYQWHCAKPHCSDSPQARHLGFD